MTVIKHWTQSEDDIIRRFWPLPGAIRKHAHLLPGRSAQAIEKRAQKISLGARILWTAEQDSVLRDVWVNGGHIKSHMHQFPGHSITAIFTRAHTLGLGKRASRSRGVETATWKLLKKILSSGDSTVDRLAEEASVNISTAYKFLGEKHKADEIHIFDWERASLSSKAVPVYRMGAGGDAPKPVPLDGALKERKYRKADLHKRVIAGVTVRTINPFAAAAGLVSVPKGTQGRVVIHLTDSKDDEYAEAA